MGTNYLLSKMYPEYGRVEGDKMGGTLVPCAQFLDSGVYYKHERVVLDGG